MFASKLTSIWYFWRLLASSEHPKNRGFANMDWKSIQYHYAKRSNYFCPLRQKHYPTVQRSNMSSIVWSWFFFFRVTSLQMMYIRDVYLHLILWGTRWPNSRYEHSILEWLQKKGFRPKAPQIDVSKGIVKVNSVHTRSLHQILWGSQFRIWNFAS